MEPTTQSEPVVVSWPSARTLLAQAFTFYKTHFRKFVFIGIIPFFFSAAGTLFALNLVSLDLTLNIKLIVVLGIFIFNLCVALLSAVHQIALIKSIAGIDTGAEISPNDAYKLGFKLFFPLIWAGILVGLTSFGGAVLLIVPGIFISIYLSFTYFTLVVEGKKGPAALIDSVYYARGHASEIFSKSFYFAFVCLGVWLLVIILGVALSYALTGNIDTLFALLSEKGGNLSARALYSILASFVSFAVYMPISFAFYYFIYKYAKSLKTLPCPEADVAKYKKWMVVLTCLGLLATVAYVLFLLTTIQK